MDKPNIKVNAENWATIVLQQWETKINALEIGYSEQLIDSLLMEVKMISPDVLSSIEFTFKYYGKFVDMGVGKGVKLSDIGKGGTDKKFKRKAKKWYSPIFFRNLNTLRRYLGEHYARQGAFIIRENISDNSNPLRNVRP